MKSEITAQKSVYGLHFNDDINTYNQKSVLCCCGQNYYANLNTLFCLVSALWYLHSRVSLRLRAFRMGQAETCAEVIASRKEFQSIRCFCIFKKYREI